MRGRNADVIRILFMWPKKKKRDQNNSKKLWSLFKMLPKAFPSVISVYKMGIESHLPAEIHYITVTK